MKKVFVLKLNFKP